MDEVSVFEESGVFSLLPPFSRSMTELRLAGVADPAFVRGVPTGFDEEAASEVAGVVAELAPVVTTGAVCSLATAPAEGSGFDIGLTSRLSIALEGSAPEGLLTRAWEVAGALSPFDLSSMLRTATPAVGSASCGAPLDEVVGSVTSAVLVALAPVGPDAAPLSLLSGPVAMIAGADSPVACDSGTLFRSSFSTSLFSWTAAALAEASGPTWASFCDSVTAAGTVSALAVA